MATKDAPRRVDLPGSIASLTTLDTLGRRLAYCRMGKDMTQVELASRLKKSRATIVQYENDMIKPPISAIEELADILEVQPEFIAFGRRGFDNVKEAEDLVAISEYVMGRDGEYAATGHALSRKMLNDFKTTHNKLGIYLLPHRAPKFNLPSCSRLIVTKAVTAPDRDHDLFLIRANDGYEVVRFEAMFANKPGELSGVTGNDRNFSVKEGTLDIVGAVVGSIQPYSRT